MAALSPRAAVLYPKYDKDWFANRVADLEAKLLAHIKNEGDECPLCALEVQVERQAETIKECHGRTAELAIRIQDLK